MSTIFLCGNFGCDIITIDDDAFRRANKARQTWANQMRLRTGKYPSLESQGEYFDSAYARFTSIATASID